MWGLEKLKGNQAAQLGLLSAGAAMLDPRGTDGNTGAALNKGVRAGLGTYIPMMQWQQNKKDRKSDRDWKKQQAMIRNVLEERQFKLRQKTFEAETANREANTNIKQAQFGLQKEKMNREIEQQRMLNASISQFYQGMTGGVASDPTKAPMRINQKTGKPYGAKREMTDQEASQLGALALSSGGDAGAIKMMMDARGKSGDPDSPRFNKSTFNAQSELAEARRLVATGQAKTLEEGIYIARKNLNADALYERQFAGEQQNYMSNIK